MEKLTIAIWMVTYNHEKYIEKALQGIISQKTDFKFILFIGEDYSTDRTREICIEYQKKYPDKIELILQEKNIGATNNAQIIYKACFESKAKYIAMCEGDDYWTDPYKLQKQVDFLEENPKYVICFHNSLVVQQDGENYVFHQSGYEATTSIKDLIERTWYIPTASVVFRNILSREDINSINGWQSGDIPLYILLGQYGKVAYVDKIMSVYRKHANGLSRVHSNEWENTCKDRIMMYMKLDERLNFIYSDSFQKAIIYHLDSIHILKVEKQFRNLLIRKAIEIYPLIEKKFGVPLSLYTFQYILCNPYTFLKFVKQKTKIRTRIIQFMKM